MKIILVRHGESEGNVAHVINDDPVGVVNLTARGRGQAEEAAAQLRGAPFVHAYVSEFARARQTAEIILGGRAVALTVDARLNERRSGMDGRHVDEFNDFVRPDPLRLCPPRGESFLQQMARLRAFLDDVAVRHPQGVVLAVSHESPILAAVALTVTDPEQVVCRSLTNCQIVVLEWPRAGPT